MGMFTKSLRFLGPLRTDAGQDKELKLEFVSNKTHKRNTGTQNKRNKVSGRVLQAFRGVVVVSEKERGKPLAGVVDSTALVL